MNEATTMTKPTKGRLPDELIRGNFQPGESKTSSVTTGWGIGWDENAIARDLLQNFYDANRDNLDAVKIGVKGSKVTVWAPATFEIERLFYLGSEKDKNINVGQYGEGFKAAALCLVRDHGVEPVVISGKNAVRIRTGEVVPGTELVPLVYDVFKSNVDETDGGTLLILEGCSIKLAKAVAGGLEHFWYEENPLVGRKLWSNAKGDTHLYAKGDTPPYAAKGAQDGVIFYRKLRRGTVPNIPVVLVIDREVGPIEKKTRQDRDRLAFGGDLVDKAYKAFAGGVPSYDREPAKTILALSKDVWQGGHGLLAALADRMRGEWSEADRKTVFGDQKQWFSAVDRKRELRYQGGADKIVRISEIESAWRKAGVKELPAYFGRFGVRNALDECNERDASLARKARRKPTQAEEAAIQVLREATDELAPEILALFEKKKTDYCVIQGERPSDEALEEALDKEELLGAYRRSEQRWDLREVWLAETLFDSEFSEALATFLHEHAHVLGYDGDRAFTDALTGLLATLVRMVSDAKSRKALELLSARWDKAREKVVRERKGVSTEEAETTISQKLAALDEDGLRELVGRVPPVVLRRLIDRRDK